MKFTLWDKLVLNLTGRLPKKTQEEVDTLLATKAMIARVAEAEHQARLAAAEKRKPKFDPNARDGDGDGLVQDGTAFERPATPKKKTTSTKKKPSKS